MADIGSIHPIGSDDIDILDTNYTHIDINDEEQKVTFKRPNGTGVWIMIPPIGEHNAAFDNMYKAACDDIGEEYNLECSNTTKGLIILDARLRTTVAAF